METTVATRTMKVETLIPPAVEPGQPPINISIIVSILVTSFSAPIFIEAKPAVLVFTD